jgi:hypothetical protein
LPLAVGVLADGGGLVDVRLLDAAAAEDVREARIEAVRPG